MTDPHEYLAHQTAIASKLTTIELILAHEFVGNHMSDSAAFSVINAFIDNPMNPINDRVAACAHICEKGIGFDPCTFDEYAASLTEI
jgi:hypothetical protein